MAGIERQVAVCGQIETWMMASPLSKRMDPHGFVFASKGRGAPGAEEREASASRPSDPRGAFGRGAGATPRGPGLGAGGGPPDGLRPKRVRRAFSGRFSRAFCPNRDRFGQN
ncbi:unnamed protein product, partial [Soboliphyme baturini]|uniref:Uncharacterized protein n=1 Tax=Soboliphyme baturini TaxID=241478 RepID=A0A183JBE1_9BILA